MLDLSSSGATSVVELASFRVADKTIDTIKVDEAGKEVDDPNDPKNETMGDDTTSLMRHLLWRSTEKRRA